MKSFVTETVVKTTEEKEKKVSEITQPRLRIDFGDNTKYSGCVPHIVMFPMYQYSFCTGVAGKYGINAEFAFTSYNYNTDHEELNKIQLQIADLEDLDTFITGLTQYRNEFIKFIDAEMASKEKDNS